MTATPAGSRRAGRRRRPRWEPRAVATAALLLLATASALAPAPARARFRLIRPPYHASPPLKGLGPDPEPWNLAAQSILADVDGDGREDAVTFRGETILVEHPRNGRLTVVAEHSLPTRYVRRDLEFQERVGESGVSWNPPGVALGPVADVDGDGARELVLTAATAHLERFALLLLDLASGRLDLEVELPRGEDRRADGIWTGQWLPGGLLPAGQAGPHPAALLWCTSQRDGTGRGLLAVDLVSGEPLWRWETGLQPSRFGPWVGDLEGDGAWEVILATNAPDNLHGERINGYSDDESFLLRFDARGRPAWQIRFGGIFTNVTLAVADLDGDGVRELVTGTSSSTRDRDAQIQVRAPDGTLLSSLALDPYKGAYRLRVAPDRQGAWCLCLSTTGLAVYRWRDGELTLHRERAYGHGHDLFDAGDLLPSPGPEFLVSSAGRIEIFDRDLDVLMERDLGYRLVNRCLLWRPDPDRRLLLCRGTYRSLHDVLATPTLVRAAPLLSLGAGVGVLGLGGAALRRRRRRRRDPRPPREILVHMLIDLCEDDGGGLQALGGLRRLVDLDGRAGRTPGRDDLWRQIRDTDVPTIRDVLARAVEVDYEPRLARATLDRLERLVRLCERPAGGRAAATLAEVEDGLRRLRGRLQDYFSDDLPRRLEAVLAMLAPELERAAVTVRRDWPEAGRIPPCLVDATDLRAILDNLVGNAVRAMREAPRRELILRIGVAGAEVRLDVVDTGPGVPADRPERIFADGHSDRRGGGFGLARSRRLARRWGGDLELLAADPGRGATFRLRLATAPEALVVPPAAEERPVTDRAGSVLPRLLAEVRQLHHGGQALARNLGRLVNALAASRAAFLQVDSLPATVPDRHRGFRERDLPRLLEVLDLADRVGLETAVVARIRENLQGLATLLDRLAAAGWPVAAAGRVHPDLRVRMRSVVADFDLLHERLKDRCSSDLGEVLVRLGREGPARPLPVLVPADELARALAPALAGSAAADDDGPGPTWRVETNRVLLRIPAADSAAAPSARLAERVGRRLRPWGGEAAVDGHDGADGAALLIALPLRR